MCESTKGPRQERLPDVPAPGTGRPELAPQEPPGGDGSPRRKLVWAKEGIALPFPFDTERWGQVTCWEEIIPGVHEMQAREHIIVVDRELTAGVLPAPALAYGIPYANGKLEYFDRDCGLQIIEYEALQAKLKMCSDNERNDLLEELATKYNYGAWRHPYYFGPWVPQRQTPGGVRTRYRTIAQGIWFVQAGGTWYFSLNQVFYEMLNDVALSYAKGNRGVYPHLTGEDLYWELKDCAVAIYRLLLLLDEQDGFNELNACITSMDDLKCCLWENFPDYVQANNAECDEMISYCTEEDDADWIAIYEAQRIANIEGASSDFLIKWW